MMPTQTKVLVISHAGVKRINRSVYALLKNHVREVTIVIPSRLVLGSGSIVFPDPREADEAQIVPLDLHGTNPRKYFYPGLLNLLDKERPQVILLENDPVSVLGFRLASWCRKNGSRLICQTYDNTPRGFQATIISAGIKAIPKNLLIHFMNFRMASRVSALLVVNQDSKQIFQQYRYRNVTQIPLGFDKAVFYQNDAFRKEYRSKIGIDEDTILVAYFGRMVKQKGVHLLLEALGSIKGMRWKLLLDHNHDNESGYSLYIRGLIDELGLSDRIVFFDADHFEISNYMRAADIMVAPSLTTPSFKEQYGRAVQEAMACGCVCVVSNSGHPKDLVRIQDLIFPEGNIAALQTILSNLITNDALRQEHQVQLVQRATADLGVDTQVRLLLELFDEMSDC